MKVAEDARTSHGNRIALANAVNVRMNEEAAMIGAPRLLPAFIVLDQTQESCRKLQSKLFGWAGLVLQRDV